MKQQQDDEGESWSETMKMSLVMITTMKLKKELMMKKKTKANGKTHVASIRSNAQARESRPDKRINQRQCPARTQRHLWRSCHCLRDEDSSEWNATARKHSTIPNVADGIKFKRLECLNVRNAMPQANKKFKVKQQDLISIHFPAEPRQSRRRLHR